MYHRTAKSGDIDEMSTPHGSDDMCVTIGGRVLRGSDKLRS